MIRLGAAAVALVLIAAACSDRQDAAEVTATIVADGLLNPIGMAALPDGGHVIVLGGGSAGSAAVGQRRSGARVN